MLFKSEFHDRIRDGSVDLTVRRWARPQVVVGNAYRFGPTADTIVVDSIDHVTFGTITAEDLQRCGFETVAGLRHALRRGDSGPTSRSWVYRVAFHFVEADADAMKAPDVTDALIIETVERLQRMDQRSKRGPWTRQVLELIAAHPQRRAGDLAPMMDREKLAFKADVRKLKALGLTQSFEVGYALTELGTAVHNEMQGS